MKTNKKTLTALLALTLMFSTYIAAVWAGTGSIRIDPPLPYMNGNPADFTIWVQGKDDACDPIIFLVMTESSYLGLQDGATVEWDGGSATLGPWHMEDTNGDKVPPGTSKGAGYTVGSLKDHLDTSGPIYWDTARILGDSIETGEIYEISVGLASESPEMLVYILGKSDCGGDYDMRVTPTDPGFVIPEVPIGTLLSALTMLGAAGLFKLKQK